MMNRWLDVGGPDTHIDGILSAGTNFLHFSCDERLSRLFRPKRTFVVLPSFWAFGFCVAFCGIPEPRGESGWVGLSTLVAVAIWALGGLVCKKGRGAQYRSTHREFVSFIFFPRVSPSK